MNTKKWFISIGVAVATALTLGIWGWDRGRDPVYEGKRFSEHLKSCSLNGFGGVGVLGVFPERPPEPILEEVKVGTAQAAILAVGTNAISLLVEMMSSGETRTDRVLTTVAKKFGVLERLIERRRVDHILAPERAIVAFCFLGDRAAAASEGVIPLLDDPDRAMLAINVLRLIRPQKQAQILSLTNVVRINRVSVHGTPPERTLAHALLTLGCFETNAAGAIPFVIEQLSSKHPEVQAAAAVALARMRAPALMVVPLILKTIVPPEPRFLMLENTNPTQRRGPPTISDMQSVMNRLQRRQMLIQQLWALAQYGTEAKSAAGVVARIAEDTNPHLRASAERTKALINGEQ